jgi:PAS domain S-box-containing protein
VEEKIRKSEELLKMTFDVTGEGIWDWNIKENTVNHNKRWCTILGLDDSRLSHSMEFFVNFLYKEDREEVVKKVTEAMISGRQYESEHRMVDINEKVVWVHDRGAVVERNEAGEAVRMIGSIADITERKEAEKELENTTERLSLATRAGEIGIWAYDIVSNNLNWDEQMFKLYGISDYTIDLVEKAEKKLLDQFLIFLNH